MKDLIVLVADKNMEFLLKGLFPRIPQIENTLEFSYEIFIHPYRDPGVLNEAHDFLRPFSDKFHFAMVIMDVSGCGREKNTREELELSIEENLFRSGWYSRCCAIVISPELENWIWVNEVRIRDAISWEDHIGIYDFLHQEKLMDKEANKPMHPKEALEIILRLSHTPRSSSIYCNIASKASYQYCQDQAFNKLIHCLRSWFVE